LQRCPASMICASTSRATTTRKDPRVPADGKLEYLKFIQATIGGMGSFSFVLKGWMVTLVAAHLRVRGEGSRSGVHRHRLDSCVGVSPASTPTFCGTSGCSANCTPKWPRKPDGDPVDFAMDVSEFRPIVTWRRVIVSKTILGFYMPVALLLAVLDRAFRADAADARRTRSRAKDDHDHHPVTRASSWWAVNRLRANEV